MIVSQVIPQWYVDVLTDALGNDAQLDIITGSSVKGNIISSPPHDAKNLKSRLVCWLKHFRFINKWINKNRNIHYDLIFAISNPPINSYVGLNLKRVFKAPFIYMNWDLYPQIIRATIKNPLVKIVCKLWGVWNSHNYPRIDKILTIGPVMASSLVKDIKNKIELEVIPVAVDTNRLKPIPKNENPFCIKYLLTDKFVVLYSGKMGIGHNIEMILEAAVKLQDNQSIQFVFIGEGPKYKFIEQFIEENKSKNILLLPLQDDEIFPQSMACGDIGIVALEESVSHLFMPSKVYSMMACGEAILGVCTDNDDLFNLIEGNLIGFAITNKSAETVALKITELYKENDKLENFKRKSRKLTVELYDYSSVTKQYQYLFKRYIGRDKYK